VIRPSLLCRFTFEQNISFERRARQLSISPHAVEWLFFFTPALWSISFQFCVFSVSDFSVFLYTLQCATCMRNAQYDVSRWNEMFCSNHLALIGKLRSQNKRKAPDGWYCMKPLFHYPLVVQWLNSSLSQWSQRNSKMLCIYVVLRLGLYELFKPLWPWHLTSFGPQNDIISYVLREKSVCAEFELMAFQSWLINSSIALCTVRPDANHV